MSQWPEHEKQAQIIDEAHSIGQFLDWAEGQGLQLCRFNDRFEEFQPVGHFVDVIAEYFEIDLSKIEAEKRAMLDKLRESNG